MSVPRLLFVSFLVGLAFPSLPARACTDAPKEVSRRIWDSLGYEGSYDPKAAAICDGMKYTLSKQACRDSLRFARFSPAALEWCASQDSDSDKQACLRGFGNAYYNATAFGVCASMRYPINRNECFASTRNKIFDSEDLARCAKEPFEPGRNTCFEAHSLCVQTDLDASS